MGTTVGEYLIERLHQIGVRDIFGVPGDFVIPFMKQITDGKKVRLINTCNELNAAYAADGYARIKGVGVVCTTFGVGELSAINGVAGSYAERIPVVVITGTPSTEAQRSKKLLHHTCGPYDTQTKMFQMITAYSALLFNADEAPEEIDRALTECLSQKRPVYINLPADISHVKCKRPQGNIFIKVPMSSQECLHKAVEAAAQMINKSKLPVILADAEITRFNLQKEFSGLLSASGIPYSCLMMGKTVLDEDHPQFIGLYMGDRSRKYVEERMNSSDCVLEIGLVMSDLNTGGFTLRFSDDNVIRAEYDRVLIRGQTYEGVYMKDFMSELSKRINRRDASTLNIRRAVDGCTHRRSEVFEAHDNPLTAARFFDRMAHYIPENAVVVADTGLSLFGVAEILMPKGATFIGQVFYGSIGYSIGASLGVAIAAPERPVILFVGDGAFQVTCQELSTIIRHKLNVDIFLINNDGYTVERLTEDGPYNDLQSWKYYKLPEVFGGSCGYEAHKERALEVILKHASQKKGDLNFVEVHLDKWDSTAALRKAGQVMMEQSKPRN